MILFSSVETSAICSKSCMRIPLWQWHLPKDFQIRSPNFLKVPLPPPLPGMGLITGKNNPSHRKNDPDYGKNDQDHEKITGITEKMIRTTDQKIIRIAGQK